LPFGFLRFSKEKGKIPAHYNNHFPRICLIENHRLIGLGFLFLTNNITAGLVVVAICLDPRAVKGF
jgi:hypothetical protein